MLLVHLAKMTSLASHIYFIYVVLIGLILSCQYKNGPLLPFSGHSGKHTCQLFLLSPEADGVDKGPQPGVEAGAELQESGVPQCQSGEEGKDKSMGAFSLK